MVHYTEQKILPFTPEHLFNVVIDVDQYDTFLPWCRHSEVIDHIPDQNKLYASVTAGYLIYSEMYVSKVTYEKPNTIRAEYVDGPFKNLSTTWTFLDHQDGCDLRFVVDFEFANTVLNSIAEHVLDQISTRMVEAFINRAHELNQNKLNQKKS